MTLQDNKGPLLYMWFHDTQSLHHCRATLYKCAAKVHAYGVIHRDMGARNIVTSTSGKISIIDFGQAWIDHKCPGEQCWELEELCKSLGIEAHATSWWKQVIGE